MREITWSLKPLSKTKISRIKKLKKEKTKQKDIAKIVGCSKTMITKYLNLDKYREQVRIAKQKRREIQSDYDRNPEGAIRRQAKYYKKHHKEINMKLKEKAKIIKEFSDFGEI